MPGIFIGPQYQLVPARHGSMLVNQNDIFMGQSFLHYGECCEREIEVLLQLIDNPHALPGMVVEVGSNMGVHTIPIAAALAQQGRSMLAIEPQPVIFQQLCANLALNGLMNVRALPYACGAQEGQACFLTPDYARAGNFGGVAFSAWQTLPQRKGVETVACFRLEALVADDPVALIKLDVEGSELAVLEGAREILDRDYPALYVENDRIESSERLIAWLLDRGYRLWWHATSAFNPDNFLRNKRNIYGDVTLINMIALHPMHRAWIEGLPEITDPADHPLRGLVPGSAIQGGAQTAGQSGTPGAAPH